MLILSVMQDWPWFKPNDVQWRQGDCITGPRPLDWPPPWPRIRKEPDRRAAAHRWSARETRESLITPLFDEVLTFKLINCQDVAAAISPNDRFSVTRDRVVQSWRRHDVTYVHVHVCLSNTSELLQSCISSPFRLQTHKRKHSTLWKRPKRSSVKTAWTSHLLLKHVRCHSAFIGTKS